MNNQKLLIVSEAIRDITIKYLLTCPMRDVEKLVTALRNLQAVNLTNSSMVSSETSKKAKD